MTEADFQAFRDAFLAEQKEILCNKGASYRGATDDRLGNFKRTAGQLGLDPAEAWAIFFLKHVDSILTYVRTGHESEGPRSRLLDIANYALLGAALMEEEACKTSPTT